MKKERIEAMQTIFDDEGITATEKQIKEVAEAYDLHIEMESEMESYQHIGGKITCGDCVSLKEQLNEAKKEIDIYRNSVMRRRNTEQVWTENDEVRYE